MPVFEFRCLGCGVKFSQLVGMTADSRDPACPKCGSGELAKLVSRFTRARGEDEKLDALEDAALVGDMDDPKSVRRWMGEMASEMGDDLGEDLDEYLDEAERELYDGESESGSEET